MNYSRYRIINSHKPKKMSYVLDQQVVLEERPGNVNV